MTLHLSLPGAHHRSNNQQQQEELREARRVLKEKIRNDWEYPTLPAYRSSGAERIKRRAKDDAEEEEDKIAGFRFHVPSDDARASRAEGQSHALGLDFDPTEWRDREEASETEGEGSGSVTGSSSSKRKSSKDDAAYQFEGPDSVATQLTERRAARKRKRKEALQEEMQWNKGLELWVHRRDQWSCARPATEVRLAERKKAAEQIGGAGGGGDTLSIPSSSPRTSTSTSSSTTTTYQASASASTPATSPSATPDVMTTTTGPNNPSPSPSSELLIPLAPPLLPPSHPIRKRISTQIYPEIYSKIILQSRTPSVPINLSTLVKALVQGWKDDGEWPPKPSGPLEPSVGRKKGSTEGGGLRGGIKRVLRVTAGVVGDGGRKEG